MQPDNVSILLSAQAPSVNQRQIAYAVSTLVLLTFAMTLPSAHIILARVPNLVVAQQSILFVSELVTAVLLFGQFSIQPSLQLNILAGGYLFSSLLLISHTLVFPGAFSETGLLGAGPQSAAWLASTWRAAPPLSIIAYVLAGRHEHSGNRIPTRVGARIAITVAAVVGMVIALTLVATVMHDRLPVIVADNRGTTAGLLVVGFILGSTLLALVALIRISSLTLLNLWLMVVMLAWASAAALNLFIGGARFSVADYVGRFYAALASCLILIVLLPEVSLLYAKVLRAVANEHRERERRLKESEAILVHLARVSDLGQFVSSLIHEVNQPLSALTNYLTAAAHLARSSGSSKLTEVVEKSREQVARTTGIIQHLRDYIKRREIQLAESDVRAMLADAVRLAMVDADANALIVEMKCDPTASSAFFDRVQIEQVVFNLVRNAIEAMAGSARRILTVAAAPSSDNMIEVSVGDTGPGLSPTIRQRLFEPFATTKASGLGIGLSICRVIVEAHGGRIGADDRPEGGTTFRFTLPRAATKRASLPSNE